MKRTFFILILLPTLTFGQRIAITFEKAIEQGISLEKLDETYQSALHSDSTKSVFVGREKEFYNSYISLLTDLQTFLRENMFKWDKANTKCFNRIYFNKDGEIDYFIFNFKSGEIETEKEKEFETLLRKFIQKYKFPLTSKSNFAQCSPVTYTGQ